MHTLRWFQAIFLKQNICDPDQSYRIDLMENFGSALGWFQANFCLRGKYEAAKSINCVPHYKVWMYIVHTGQYHRKVSLLRSKDLTLGQKIIVLMTSKKNWNHFPISQLILCSHLAISFSLDSISPSSSHPISVSFSFFILFFLLFFVYLSICLSIPLLISLFIDPSIDQSLY